MLALSDADVFAVAAIVMDETMEASSAVVEAVGNYLGVDMADLWTPDQAFFDLIRDRQIANAMLREIGGKEIGGKKVAARRWRTAMLPRRSRRRRALSATT